MSVVGFVKSAILVFICVAAKASQSTKDVCIRRETIQNLAKRKSKGTKSQKLVERLAGGSPVEDGQYPYIVSLRELFGKDPRNEKDYRYFCGAALIDPSWAITSASCVDVNKAGVEDPAVFGGTIQRNGPFSEVSFTSKAFIHPGWISNPHARAGFDVALLKLPCPSNLPTIKLPPRDFKPNLADLWAAGWGRTGPSGPFVDILNEVQLPWANLRICRKELKSQLAESLICAGRGIGKVCQGDTGAPLVAKSKSKQFQEDVLVGISPEFVDNCRFVGKPIVFTSIVAVRDWIEETIAKNADPKPVFGVDIVKALKKGSKTQPDAVKLVKLAVKQEREFAILGAVKIAAKRGVVPEIATAIVEAVENGVDEDILNPAFELASENL